jgi:hypothetical protein
MPQQAKERGMPFETLIPLIKPLFDGLRAVKNFFHKGNEESNADGCGGKGCSGSIVDGTGLILCGRGGRGGRPTAEEAEMAAAELLKEGAV